MAIEPSMPDPAVAAIPNDYDLIAPYEYPGGCVLGRNIGWNNDVFVTNNDDALSHYEVTEPNIEDADVRFVDEANLELRLRTDSAAFTMEGFLPIPFDLIGAPHR